MISIVKKVSYLEHFVLWLFMFMFILDYHFLEGNWMEAITWTSVEIGFYMSVFYFNYLVTLPLLLQKKRLGLYIASTLACLIIYISFVKISGAEAHLYSGAFWRNVASMTINFALFWLVSTLHWFYWKQQEKRELQLQIRAEKLEMEMKFLKTQISPHFIFNTLNNIYSLVQQGHQNAALMLTKLSSILRYTLYDSSQEKVLLKKELNIIRQYIELQQLRKLKSLNIDFYLEDNGNSPKIVPLLLLSFVENCFKHGDIERSEDAWIKISCMVNEHNELHFWAENSIGPTILKQKEVGLGNRNIRRQLELNYPAAHQLRMETTEAFFTVELKIQLEVK